MSNKVDNSSFSNQWYKPGGTPLKRITWYFINALFLINPLNPFSGVKIFFLRLFGAQIGKGVVIKPAVNIKYPWRLKVADYCWIGENVWIDNLADVSLGKSVCLSQGAMLLTGNHNYKKSTFDLIIKDIVLEEGVWIGAHAVVCQGVICQSHSVLSVNSVATENLNSYTIYQGNPAVSIRKREII